MSKEPTVYIVDDDHGSRTSVRALVRSMGVAGQTFDSAEAFLAEFNPAWPGCLVTDLRMQGMSGVELQTELASIGCPLPVIIITAHAETPITVAAVKGGAVTVLEKPCRDYELLDAIQQAMARDKMNRAASVNVQEFMHRLSSLTDQETVVLELMIDGLANKVMANRLGKSIRTIEARRQRVFEKTGTGSLAELVRLFVESRQFENQTA